MPYRRNYTNKALDKRIRKIEMDEELKYFDLSGALTPAAGAEDSELLNGVTQGSSVGERDGYEIQTTSITIRMIIQSQSSRLLYSQVRIIVFWCSSTLSGSPNIVGSTSAGTQAVLDNTVNLVQSNMLLPYSREYVPGQFKILYDKVYTFNPKTYTAITADTPGADVFNEVTGYLALGMFKKIHIPLSRKVRYDTANGGITDLAGNSLWIAACADVSANPPIVNFISRLNYKDT